MDFVHAVTSIDLVTRALVRGGDVDLVIFGVDEPKPQQVFWADDVIGEEVCWNCGEASNQRMILI